jgi:hypothetical protein
MSELESNLVSRQKAQKGAKAEGPQANSEEIKAELSLEMQRGNGPIGHIWTDMEVPLGRMHGWF